MKTSKKLEAILRTLCEAPGPEDGLPLPRRSGRGVRDAHRDQRLCGQVARILSLELDDALVLRVELAPDAGRLRVWVRTDDPEALARQRPRLRAAVAAGTQRKRAPELIFALESP